MSRFAPVLFLLPIGLMVVAPAVADTPPAFANAAFYAATNVSATPSTSFNSLVELSDGTVVVAGSTGSAAQFSTL